jgi:hypothetical protein
MVLLQLRGAEFGKNSRRHARHPDSDPVFEVVMGAGSIGTVGFLEVRQIILTNPQAEWLYTALCDWRDRQGMPHRAHRNLVAERTVNHVIARLRFSRFCSRQVAGRSNRGTSGWDRTPGSGRAAAGVKAWTLVLSVHRTRAAARLAPLWRAIGKNFPAAFSA